MDEQRNQLLVEISRVSEQSRRFARRNYWAAYLVTTIAVFSSVSATILAASNAELKSLTATLAALPGAVLVINATLKFEHKAAWHWKRNKLMEGLRRALEFEHEETEVISREFSRIDGQMEQEWVRFGDVKNPSTSDS